ncbi:hypothetical protein CD153_11495 [Staphylococcus carnosus]|nr:hypothetical protein CD153_11495 [Staphylococcus carnosus]
MKKSITLMTNNNAQHLIGVGLMCKFIHKYILSLWKEETGLNKQWVTYVKVQQNNNHFRHRNKPSRH